ncbi:MAG: hypothetical protein IJ572_01390 [Bacilli bacterium]|nr:hypothetical protein [Bacilli bacterium]
MRGHKKTLVFDLILVVMTYLIFAFSLLAVNMIRYQNIKVGFYGLLIISGILMYYCVRNFNKGIK